MAFEEFKLKRKMKKEEKKIIKEEKVVETLSKTNEIRSDLSKRSDKVRTKSATEEWHSKNLDRHKLESEVRAARQNLYVQRDKLLRRMITFQKEYHYIKDTKKNTPLQARELKRCSTGYKNAMYALAVVESAIDRLDDLQSEHEWHEIMHDLTKGYKTVNAISVGSDLMTRFAYWLQKAKMEMNGDISVHAMEHYYGKSINELLEDSDITKDASQILVSDSALDLDNSDDIIEAVRWGTVFTVPLDEVTAAVEEQSKAAGKTGGIGIIDKPNETSNVIGDLAGAVEKSDVSSTSNIL